MPKARVVFLPEGEASLRHWLNRPSGDPVLDKWMREAEFFKDSFQDLSILKLCLF